MEKAEAMKMAQKLRKDGLSYRAISDQLAEAGYVTNTGKAISPGNINRWLAPDKPKGKPQKRATGVQTKLPEPVREPSPEERIERLTAAHKASLKEVDRMQAELSEARKLAATAESELVESRQELSTLRETHLSKCQSYMAEIEELKFKITDTEKGTKPNMDELQQAVTFAVAEAVKPLYAEIAELKERYESFLRVNKPREQNPVHVLGWNVQRSGKYFKAYKKVNNKVRGIHIGPEYDEDQAKDKIVGAIRRNGSKWGLSSAEIESLVAGNAPEPSGPEFIRDLIKRHGGQSGTAPIYRVRQDYEAEGHKDFDATLMQLAGQYNLELLHGDPGETPEGELSRNPKDETGAHFINLQWVK